MDSIKLNSWLQATPCRRRAARRWRRCTCARPSWCSSGRATPPQPSSRCTSPTSSSTRTTPRSWSSGSQTSGKTMLHISTELSVCSPISAQLLYHMFVLKVNNSLEAVSPNHIFLWFFSFLKQTSCLYQTPLTHRRSSIHLFSRKAKYIASDPCSWSLYYNQGANPCVYPTMPRHASLMFTQT